MAATNPLALRDLQLACSNCNMRELCLPMGLEPAEIAQLDELISVRRRIKAGENLYRTGDRFDALYAIRRGFFKTETLREDGHEQVTGFHMVGEIMGMDGISTETHACRAIALEDSEVCPIPFGKLEQLGRNIRSLQHHFHKLMSSEIIRDHTVMMLLGGTRGEKRVAAFLLNLSQRLSTLGYSSSEFNLRMKREEIGSYLGMNIATVSRALTFLQQQQLIQVQHKSIKIINIAGLEKFSGQDSCSHDS